MTDWSDLGEGSTSAAQAQAEGYAQIPWDGGYATVRCGRECRCGSGGAWCEFAFAVGLARGDEGDVEFVVFSSAGDGLYILGVLIDASHIDDAVGHDTDALLEGLFAGEA